MVLDKFHSGGGKRVGGVFPDRGAALVLGGLHVGDDVAAHRALAMNVGGKLARPSKRQRGAQGVAGAQSREKFQCLYRSSCAPPELMSVLVSDNPERT
jgi:hypothetical protein